MTEKLSTENLQERFRAVEENLEEIEHNVTVAAQKAGKTRTDITVLAATKTVPVEIINYSIEKGIAYIGENKVQELMDKYDAYEKDKAQVHFIGHLQVNKIKYLVGRVQMIQSVDSMKLAKEISRLSQKREVQTKILVEVNIGREENKSGVLPENLESLLEEISVLPNISICGLMAIPPANVKKEETLHYFSQMYEYFVDMSRKKLDNVSMDYLSMGMSADYAEAIECGANMVRIGSALYGARDYSKKNV